MTRQVLDAVASRRPSLSRMSASANAARLPGFVIQPWTVTRPVSREMALNVPDDVLAAGVLVWAALFGAVSFEVFGQYGADTFSDTAALFDVQLELLVGVAGFPAAADAAKPAK